MNETFPVLIVSKLLDQVIKAHARWRWRAWTFSAGPAGPVPVCLFYPYEMPLLPVPSQQLTERCKTAGKSFEGRLKSQW